MISDSFFVVAREENRVASNQGPVTYTVSLNQPIQRKVRRFGDDLRFFVFVYYIGWSLFKDYNSPKMSDFLFIYIIRIICTSLSYPQHFGRSVLWLSSGETTETSWI